VPVFCDVREDTFNLDTKSFEAAITHARTLGLKPRAVIAVDLFGQPADYDAITEIADTQGIAVLGDAAQSFGATYNGRRVGSLCPMTATSFFPAKPLGCYGDGGAVFADDPEVVERLKSLRAHGGGKDKYDNQRIGLNGRLDTIQAAVLLEKLAIFDDEIEKRQQVAEQYTERLGNIVGAPVVPHGLTSVWAQYTITTERRDAVAAHLRECGIPTAIYYPLPLNRQTAYGKYPTAPGDTPVSDRLAGQVISLPMHPYLSEETQDRIVSAVRAAL
jgi:dTDP-4-amino-4,6-dideoxygalactose transaminase